MRGLVALVLVLSFAGLVDARPSCPRAEPTVTLPTACVGEATTGSVPFCFSPDTECARSGVVLGIVPPAAPFFVSALHVDGPSGTRPVDFFGGVPVLLAPGERIVAEVTAVLPAPGSVQGSIAWLVASDLEDPADEQSCTVILGAGAPACAGPTPASPCASETCVAGACVPTTVAGPCDDGDPCTVGDTCVDGVCRGHAGPCGPDAYECTDEICDGPACRHVPDDARCGSDECALGTCRPGEAAADARGCVTVPAGEGQPCTDDGLACTDDVCTAGGCLHIPIDQRCEAADECTQARCAPDRVDRDARGCVADASTSADTRCSEDGDPCTDDVCQAGRCAHVAVAETAACAPLRAPFQQALGLGALTRGLMATVGTVASAGTQRPVPSMTSGLLRLGQVDGDLEAALRALAGREDAGAASGGPSATAEPVAQARARLASVRLARTPREVRAFLALVGAARSQLGREMARPLARRGRLLLRGTKTLKGDLQRLQQVSRTFAR